jgi:hypothetical protein
VRGFAPGNPFWCDFVIRPGTTEGQNITDAHIVFDNYYRLVVPLGSDIVNT